LIKKKHQILKSFLYTIWK